MPATGQQKKFDFFVNNTKFETDQSTITGAQIKAMVPGLDPTYSLFLEGRGGEPDKLIGDKDSVPLVEGEGGIKKFYTAPPATFGQKCQ